MILSLKKLEIKFYYPLSLYISFFFYPTQEI